MSPKALISGIAGQDGSYLAEWLVYHGYEVHGVALRTELDDPKRNLWRLASVLPQLQLHAASVENYSAILEIIQRVQPDECYHLAAQSFVSYSFDEEFSVVSSNIDGTHYLLSALKAAAPACKFFFAASSEVFGRATSSPQREDTPFHPRSIYGITKASGFYLTSYYRDSHGMFACNGILYNHESPRRGVQFVTRKITNGAVKIKLGLEKELRLGNLDAVRDWGFAGDYVEAMWRMLQQPKADDYVIASGQTHSVRELCDAAFTHVGLNYQDYVVVDPKFFRPAEQVPLVGDSSKARERLGWQPRTTFSELIGLMVEQDLRELAGKAH